MSASNKKKLRKEQSTDVLSTKQLQEKAEAKQLRVYTISFLVAMLVVVCVAIGVLSVRAVRNSGVIQKATIAANVGDRELNTVELSYYYIDAINSFYNEWHEYYSDNINTYLQAMGLDATKPLDEQVQDEETGKTWAAYFVDEAIKKATHDYAMYDLAMAEGFTLSEDDKASYESAVKMVETYASIYGYSNPNQYLRALYGYGSELDSYSQYCERSAIATAYYAAYEDRLVYSAEDRNAYSADKEMNFNSYTYTSLYMSYNFFHQGGTEDEHGHKTYTAAEDNSAREAMEKVAKDLATSTSIDELKSKAAAVEVNEGSDMSVTEKTNALYTTINADLGKWLAEEGRQAGDIAAIPNTSTTTDDDGNETSVVNGYYIAIYQDKTDNTSAMADLRYIFVGYEGGKEDEHGHMTYTDEEKEAAKTNAESILKQLTESEMTHAAMEQIADNLTSEGKVVNHGDIKNLNVDSQYDEKIVTWALDASRVANDSTIIEADDGFYVLCYTGKSALNYREYMIETEMRAADYEKWYNGIIDAVETSVGNTSKMDLGITLSAE